MPSALRPHGATRIWEHPRRCVLRRAFLCSSGALGVSGEVRAQGECGAPRPAEGTAPLAGVLGGAVWPAAEPRQSGFVTTNRRRAALFDGPFRRPKWGEASPSHLAERSAERASRGFGEGMAASKPTPQSVMRWRTGSPNEPGESLGDLGRWSGLFPLRLRTFAPGVSQLRAAFGDA